MREQANRNDVGSLVFVRVCVVVSVLTVQSCQGIVNKKK